MKEVHHILKGPDHSSLTESFMHKKGRTMLLNILIVILTYERVSPEERENHLNSLLLMYK
jgi:hypothetical protein